MCKKNLWNFLRFYRFIWFSLAKEFKCSDAKSRYFMKETYLNYELIAIFIFPILIGVLDDFVFDDRLLLSVSISFAFAFIYTLYVVIKVWFFKLDDVFEREHEEEKHR